MSKPRAPKKPKPDPEPTQHLILLGVLRILQNQSYILEAVEHDFNVHDCIRLKCTKARQAAATLIEQMSQVLEGGKHAVASDARPVPASV